METKPDHVSGDQRRPKKNWNRHKKHSGNNRSGARRPRPAPAVTNKGDVSHLEVNVTQGSFIVFDLETTGGNPDKNGITEIAAVIWENGQIVDKFCSLVNPRIPIPPIVRKMTGITNAMVKDAPLIEEIMPKFVEFIGNRILVSHNTIGDMKFLRHFSQQTTGHAIENYFLCTHLLIEKLAPGAPDKSLKGLAKYYELPHTGVHHRAEADAFLTLELFRKLSSMLIEKQVPSIIEAIRLQGDFESASRLGWGVAEEQLQGIPAKPGTLFLHNYQGQVIFLAGTHNLAQEVNKLKRFWDLPRQLVKVVLSSSAISFQETESHFAASLAEVDGLKQHKTRFVPEQWHQRTANFVYLTPESQGFRLQIGSLAEGCVIALGPVHGNREAYEFLDHIGTAFNKKAGRKGLELSVREGEALIRFFHPEYYQQGSLKDWLMAWVPFIGKDLKETQQWLQRLKRIKIPSQLKNLSHHTGLLVVPVQNHWAVYCIDHGLVTHQEVCQHNPDALLNQPETLRRLYEYFPSVKSDPHARAPRSLNEWDVAVASRISWWIHFGIRRDRGRFVSIHDIKNKLG